MGDRDWRSSRDARADRGGPQDSSNNNSSSGGGGRYNRALNRRDAGGDQSGYDSRRRGTSPTRDFPPHQRPRLDGGYDPAWQPTMPPHHHQQNYAGGDFDGSNNNNNHNPYDMSYPNQQMQFGGPMPSFQQQPFYPDMPFGMPGFGNVDMHNNNNNYNGGGGNGMSQTDLLQFLLQQQQQTAGSSPMPDPFYGGGGGGGNRYHHHGNYGYTDNDGDDENNNAPRVPNSAAAASRLLPSVAEFVPVVPKSLLSLVRGNGDGGGGDAMAGGGATTGSPAPAGAGALVVLEAPKIAPEMDRRAREQRRAHISGFPNGTTREELEDYFRLLLPEVRRLKTEREIRQLAEETGLLKEEGEDGVRQIPANANFANIDEVKDLTLSQGKVKAFSFIELRLADMLDELVEQCQADPQRFLFTSALDGRSYPLTIRRPRDTVPLTGVEMTRVVMIGFPLSMPAETIKPVFESFGSLIAFDVKNGYAYGEFADLRDATDFRADVHGLVLGNSVVVALPLYDWLKALLVREGVDIIIADDDPVSGNYVMKQVRERLPDLSTAAASANGGGGGDGTGPDGSRSLALVLAEDPAAASLQLMRELLDMSYTLPDMLARFAGLYPHLRPLYGNAQVTLYPTPVLVLLNLFDEDELIYDSTYSQLLADIEEEVEKHGRVRRLIVPRRGAKPKLPEAPKPGVDFEEDDAAAKEAAMAAYAAAKKDFGAVLGRFMTRQTHPVWGGYGRVFVEYETVDEAAEAQQQIAGKLFGDRTVVTSFMFPDLLKEDTDAPEEAEEEEGSGHSEKGDVVEKEEEEDDEQAPAEDREGAGSAEDAVDGKGAESVESEHAEDID